jgi:hypothetical protein
MENETKVNYASLPSYDQAKSECDWVVILSVFVALSELNGIEQKNLPI